MTSIGSLSEATYDARQSTKSTELNIAVPHASGLTAMNATLTSNKISVYMKRC